MIKFQSRSDSGYHFVSSPSDPYSDEGVKCNDLVLHQTLCEIFRERSFTCRDQIKELLLASRHTDPNSIMRLILEREPGIGEIFPEGNEFSLLWIAVLRCYQYSAELLVRSGADVNERCGVKFLNYVDEKTSILHLLLQMYPSAWNERFVGLLLKHGADLQARDSKGKTVLHRAADKDRVRASRLILERGADANTADNEGLTPLLTAACGRKAGELVPLLLKHGADVTVRDKDGMNALHYLIFSPEQHIELARDFIEKGASLDDRERFNQQQPLHLAAREGKNELVKLFLDHGADVNALAKDDKFPLYLGVECRQPAVPVTLLKYGANCRLKTTLGHSALHAAFRSWSLDVKKVNAEVLSLLIKRGCDVTVRDDGGMNILHFLGYAPVELVELARFSIEKGVSLDDKERSQQYQPIHVAAREGKHRLVKLFLEHGANVNARAKDGEFPLYLAAKYFHSAALRTLLKGGANIDLKTIKGHTALHGACCRYWFGIWHYNETIVKILVSVGADMFVKDREGKMPVGLTQYFIRVNFMDSKKGPRIRLIPKTLALRKACQQSSSELKGEKIIKQSSSNLWAYYQDCAEQLSRTKSARFYKSCTVFELLTKCQCQISALMCNPEFESNFKLYNLDPDLDRDFSEYAEDTRRAFGRAQAHYRSFLEQIDVINEAVYNILPWLIVRKVARYAHGCEECEMKKNVRASRSGSDITQVNCL